MILSARIVQNSLLSLLALILLLGVLWATVSGTRASKSDTILKNTAAIQTGLKHFFNDQNRYPTVVEFQDRNIMNNYLSELPLQNIPGGSCEQTYSYSSPTAKTYELNFCLPKAAGGFAAGWNKLKSP